MGERAPSLRRFEPLLLAAILLLAAFLRFHDLDSIPPGLTHDEADVGFYAAAVARGEPANYDVPYGYAYEPYGQYSAGLLMKLLGQNDYTLRVHQTLYGLLVVGLTYVWARMAFGWLVAAGASALAAVLFWTVFTSRMALNSQPVPAVFLIVVIALWRALFGGVAPEPPPGAAGPWTPKKWFLRLFRKRRSRFRKGSRGLGPRAGRGAEPRRKNLPRRISLWWVVFAIGVAAMLHIYEAARVVWFALPLFAVYLWAADRERLKRGWRGYALALGAGTAAALSHLLDPGAWGRTEVLGSALGALRDGDPGPLVQNVLEGLRTITVSGDTLITYNIPNRPVLGTMMSLFFIAGLLYVFANWRRSPAHAFLLLWLAFGLAPTLITGAYTSTLHSIAVQPAVCILAAVGGVEIPRALIRLFRDSREQVIRGVAIVWVGALALEGINTANDYFVTWAGSPSTRAVYFHTLAAITDYIDANLADADAPIAISSSFPEPPLDPFIGQMRIQADVDVRWMNARYAVTLPAGADAMYLIDAAYAPLGSALRDLLQPALIERVDLEPDDYHPYFNVYRVSLDSVHLEEALIALPEDTVFGEAVALRGCRAAIDDNTLAVTTQWEVLDPAALGEPPSTQYAHELNIFVHALNAEGSIVVQIDTLSAPASDWRAGDTFIHVFSFEVDELPAQWSLVTGVYDRVTFDRLPLTVDGVPAGDALPLDCLP